MKVLYRCPQCSSVIERSTDWDELARLAPERAVYECGICGNIMPGATVLSGAYDLAPDEPQIRPRKFAIRDRLRKFMRSASTTEYKIPFLHDVLTELKQHHKAEYVYRGQTKLWPGALLPSAYRGIVSSTQFSDWKPPMRLREIGTTFHEEVPLLTNDTGKTRQLRIANYLRLLFGYPLAQVLGQHYGFTSEGLDVTNDPDVAAFFASFDFRAGQFVESAQESGVIYRFTVKSRIHTLAAFKTYNLYNCPTYLQPDVLNIFGTCDSLEESYNSLLTYIARMNETAGVGHSPDRSLDLIRFPAEAINASRVSRQRAGLLFPDLVLSESYRNLALAPPPGKAVKVGLNAIEDLSTRAGVKVYRFRHSEQSKRFIRSYKARLFPQQDGLHQMLNAFLNGLMPQIMFITERGVHSAF